MLRFGMRMAAGSLRLVSRCRSVQMVTYRQASRLPLTEEEGLINELTVHCRKRQIPPAMDVFQTIVDNGYAPCSKTLGRLAHLCVSELHQDNTAFDRVVSYVEREGVVIDAGLGSCFILGFIETGRKEQAEELYEKLHQDGVRVRVQATYALLDAALRDKDVEVALKYLKSLTTVPPLRVSQAVMSHAMLLGAGQLVLRLMGVYHAAERPVEQEVATQFIKWLEMQSEGYRILDTTVDSSGFCSCCGQQLEGNSLSSSQHLRLLACVNDLLTEETNSFLDNSAEVHEVSKFRQLMARKGSFIAVLDGLNAAHVCTRKPSVPLMLQIAKDVRDTLGGEVLVIARKHIAKHLNLQHKEASPTTSGDQLRGLYFFFTRNRVADDNFFLYGSLASGPKTYFVSNDMLGDQLANTVPLHLGPLFRQWQRSRQVTITGSYKRPTLKFPVSYKDCVQWTDNSWHLPVVKENTTGIQWLCITRR